MKMNISDFEKMRVDIIESGESAENKSLALTCLSQEIRRCAWNPHAHKTAHALARDCDEVAASLVGGSVNPAPRFDALVSNGIIHGPIK
jgi:hypothetical protein